MGLADFISAKRPSCTPNAVLRTLSVSNLKNIYRILQYKCPYASLAMNHDPSSMNHPLKHGVILGVLTIAGNGYVTLTCGFPAYTLTCEWL